MCLVQLSGSQSDVAARCTGRQVKPFGFDCNSKTQEKVYINHFCYHPTIICGLTNIFLPETEYGQFI